MVRLNETSHPHIHEVIQIHRVYCFVYKLPFLPQAKRIFGKTFSFLDDSEFKNTLRPQR